MRTLNRSLSLVLQIAAIAAPLMRAENPPAPAAGIQFLVDMQNLDKTRKDLDSLPRRLKEGDRVTVVVKGFNPFVHRVEIKKKSTAFPIEVPKELTAAANMDKSQGGKTAVVMEAAGSTKTGVQAKKLLSQLAEVSQIGSAVESILLDASKSKQEIKQAVIELFKKTNAIQSRANEAAPEEYIAALGRLVEEAKLAQIQAQIEGTEPYEALAINLVLPAHISQHKALEKLWSSFNNLPPELSEFFSAKPDELEVTVTVTNIRMNPEKVVAEFSSNFEVRPSKRWLFGTAAAFTKVRDQAYRVAPGADRRIEVLGDQGDARTILGAFATYAWQVGPVAIGPTLGLGLANGQKTGYLLGFSVLFPLQGRHIGLTFGLAATTRKELASDFKLGESAPADLKTVPTQDVLRTGGFFALSYQF